MKKYKTALGRPIDMNELFARNERTRAVGNMKVNARGDTIDSSGKIIESVTNKVANRNSKTVGNRSAQPTKPTTPVKRPGKDPEIRKPTATQQVQQTTSQPIVQPQMVKPVVPELSEYEKQLEQEMEDDIFVENIKANEGKKSNG